MNKFLSLLFLLFASLQLWAQENSADSKEFKISTGIGLASATENIKSPGSDIWMEFDYKALKNFSIAMEFEGMKYKRPGFGPDIPGLKNEAIIHDNNFSFLIKYHFPTTKKLSFDVASGWTFCVTQSEYYTFETDSSSISWFPNVTSFSDYKIPFLGEASYFISKKLDVIARAKFNLDSEGNGDAYSVSVGLSLRL